MNFRTRFQQMDWNEINSMSDAQLKSTLRSAQKLVNADFKKVSARSDGTAPAVRGLSESGGKISTKGDRAQMLREMNRAKVYMNSKTGTLTGWKSYEKKTAEMFPQYAEFSNDQKADFWRWVDDFRKGDQGQRSLYMGIGSGDTIQRMTELYRDKDSIDLTEEMGKYYEELKEREQAPSTASFFS